MPRVKKPKPIPQKVLDRIAELDALEAARPAAKPRKRWYVLKVVSGKQKQVRREVLRNAKVRFLGELVGRIVVAKKTRHEYRKGRRVLVRRAHSLGYLLCHLAVTAETLRLFNGAVDSLGLMPERYSPTPIPDDEAERILNEQKEDRARKYGTANVFVDFEPGDAVEVLHGTAFGGFEGKVKKVLDNGSKDPTLKVTVEVLGRPVDVDLKHDQIKKLWQGGE